MDTFKYMLGIILSALISIIFYLIGNGNIFNDKVIQNMNGWGLYITYFYGIVIFIFLIFIAFFWWQNKGNPKKINPLFELVMSGFLSAFLSAIFVLLYDNSSNNVFVYLSFIIILTIIMIGIILNHFIKNEQD